MEPAVRNQYLQAGWKTRKPANVGMRVKLCCRLQQIRLEAWGKSLRHYDFPPKLRLSREGRRRVGRSEF